MQVIRGAARLIVGFIFFLTAYDILFKGIDYIERNLGSGIYSLINHLTYFLCTTIGEIPASILLAMSGTLIVLYPLLRKRKDKRAE